MGLGDISFDVLASFCIETVKHHFNAKIDEAELRNRLNVYLTNKQKDNYSCSLDAEIDFEGLMRYIEENMIDDVEQRMFNPDRKAREKARNDIISAALSHSKAATRKAEKRVIKYVDGSMNIIRDFIKTGIPKRYCLLATIIVDAVRSNTEEITMEQTEQLKEAMEEVAVKYRSLISTEKGIELMETHQYETIEHDLNNLFGNLSVQHPLFPDFGVDYYKSKLISKPLTDKAKVYFPPNYKIEAQVRIGDRQFTASDGNPFDYSYRHQVPLIMEISKAVKYLGPVEDPLQFEAHEMTGKEFVAHPPAFPEAFPCSIKVGSKTFYDYVLLRTREILDNGIYVLSNAEQGSTFYFEVRINPSNPGNPDFNMRVNHGNNRDLLSFIRFINALTKDNDLHIYNLNAEEDLLAGHIEDVGHNANFPSIEEEIDFLERLCDIEEYFGISLAVSGNISQKDYDTVLYISDLVRNDKVKYKWTSFSFSGTINEKTRNSLLEMSGHQMISAVGECKLELFGSVLEFEIYREYCDAIIVDYEKMKKKLAVLEDGDTIKITIHPDENNTTATDSLRVPEHLTVSKALHTS